MISGGTVPSEHSESQRTPAWPEVPPAWPEVPPGSSFTPSARSFETAEQAADPSRHTGEYPPLGPSGNPSHSREERVAYLPPASYGETRADDPYGMPQSSQHVTGPNPFPPPSPASYRSDPLGVRPEPARQDGWSEQSRQDVWGPPPRREQARQDSAWSEPARADSRRPEPAWPDPALGDPSRPDPLAVDPLRPDPLGVRQDRPGSSPDPLRDDPLGVRQDPLRSGPSPDHRPDPLAVDPLRPDPLGQAPRPDPLRDDRLAFGGAAAADATMSLPTPSPPVSSAPGPDATMSMPAPAVHPQAAPGGPPPAGQPGPEQRPGFPGAADPYGQRPREGMERADDPYRPFVTAGQISGPKTPPAHRQEELWNTVFGPEGERSSDDDYYDDENRRPIWLFALLGTVVIALIAALVWAFVSGPLSGESPDDTKPSSAPSAKQSAPVAGKQASLPALPTFKGTPSPVAGTVTDSEGKITLPKLGGPWQYDQRTQHIHDMYGFATRQYVAAGMTTGGKPQFAQVMTGPLDKSLAAKYNAGEDLSPVITSVMLQARQKLFDKDTKFAKAAQQRLSRGGMTGQLVAYTVKSGAAQTTAVVAALNTGGELPTIVYMHVPKQKDELLPDINTVFKRIRPVG
ncbi:hypothetical protein [Microtetraspora malaysiensis]|uniref:Uncharacterized protein n=1 Tax=Microtetraspora malaysiensis TaxID=161358 RepID=A0ABW6SRY5_9ACTN